MKDSLSSTITPRNLVDDLRSMDVPSMINLVPGASLGLKLILIFWVLLVLLLLFVLLFMLADGLTGLLGRPLLKII